MSRNVNVVVMGKTGVGKSTLVNAVFKKNLATTGVGSAITTKIEKYRESICLKNQAILFTVYDTVGLEIDSEKNHLTLAEIESYISSIVVNCENDNNIIWYCINPNINRFEQYEAYLLQQLSYKYEIPFIIVLTQSWSKKSNQELESWLRTEKLDYAVIALLASDYETDVGNKKAFGIEELLLCSTYHYNELKIKVLEEKVRSIEKNQEPYNLARQKSLRAVEKYADEAYDNSSIVALFSLKRIYSKMISEIGDIYNIPISSNDNHATIYTIKNLTSAILDEDGEYAKQFIENEGKNYINKVETERKITDGIDELEKVLERLKKEINQRKEL